MQTEVLGAGPVRPLLKWAGGKRQLLAAIDRHSPTQFKRYVEPFLGSGALFFHLFGTGRLRGVEVRLADINADLIGCYRTLRDHTDEVVRLLAGLEREHRRHERACYYRVRDELFNPWRARLFAEYDNQQTAARNYPPALAAMLIYLNRTGFNGLFRLNRAGGFNVPVGRYVNPRICDPRRLRTVATALRESRAVLEWQPFEAALKEAAPGDFVYCDPPYAPLSRTASFASYTAGGFSTFDQRRLQLCVVAACARGACVVLSNSSAPEIVSAYTAPDAASAGLILHRVPARRAINSRATARGTVDEVIVTNVRRVALASVAPKMAPARPRPRRKSA